VPDKGLGHGKRTWNSRVLGKIRMDSMDFEWNNLGIRKK
jgi:hypothetical protein